MRRLPRHLDPAGADDHGTSYICCSKARHHDLKATQGNSPEQKWKPWAVPRHRARCHTSTVVASIDIVAKRAEDEKLKRYAEKLLSSAESGARLTTAARIQPGQRLE